MAIASQMNDSYNLTYSPDIFKDESLSKTVSLRPLSKDIATACETVCFDSIYIYIVKDRQADRYNEVTINIIAL